MKALLLSLSLALCMGAALAGPQQERMKTCNADAKAKNLAGEERKTFMKSCLSGDTPAAGGGKTTQQEKMKTCNAEAKGKTGDERKAFMKDCLSK